MSYPIVWRRRLKLVLDKDEIDGTPIYELYATLRGRGFYVGWGSTR